MILKKKVNIILLLFAGATSSDLKKMYLLLVFLFNTIFSEKVTVTFILLLLSIISAFLFLSIKTLNTVES